jgi:hypothetical protein
VILVILALLPALFWWRLIAPNPADRMNIPAGDFTGQYYPLRAYATAELAAGRLPLWNPAPYGGQPALADIQSGALYPPQVVQALVLAWLGLGFPVWALELQAIAHFSWAAVGAYLLGRRLARRSGAMLPNARFAGAVASLVFTYSGYLTGFPVQQLTILEVSAWAPWVLLSIDGLAARAWRLEISPPAGPEARTGWTAGQGDWRSLIGTFVLAGLALGLPLLPGHPQTSLYVIYIAVAYYFFRALSQPAADHGRQTDGAGPPFAAVGLRSTVYGRLPAIGYLLLALLLGLALAAAQLLPTLEFIAHSPRADLSYAAVSFGLPLHELVALVYPGYFGGSPQYLGVVPMLLIGLALALGRPRREVAFWAVAGLLAVLLSLGGSTFLYPLFYLLAPGFDAVRHQERALLAYALSGAVLSGYGALALATPLSRMRRAALRRFERGLRVLWGVALALTFLFFYGWTGSAHRDLFAGVLHHHVLGVLLLGGSILLLALRPTRGLRRPWGMALLTGWIAFNLFSVNWRFNLEQPGPTGPFAPTPLTEFLKAQTGPTPGRVRIASAGLLPGGAGAASVYGLGDITGNTPLNLADVETFEQRVPEWRRWQLLNVGYVLSDRDLDSPGLTRVFPAGDLTEGQVRVYAMGDPFPRAWVVHAVEVIAAEEAALARLSADTFDLRRVAVVNEPLGLALPGPTDASTARPGRAREPRAERDEALAEVGSRAQVLAFAPDGISLRVDAVADGLLVLSEVYYPGWRASVDGLPARVLRADGLLRGIPISQGQHMVRVWYAPASVRAGLAISALALILTGIVGIWYALRRL